MNRWRSCGSTETNRNANLFIALGTFVIDTIQRKAQAQFKAGGG